MARLRLTLPSWIPRVRCWSCWRRMSSCKLLHGIYITNWSTAVWSQSLVFLSTVLTLLFSSYTMICFYPCHPAHRFLVNCRKLWKASYSCNWPSAAPCFLMSFNSRKYLFRVLSSDERRFWARSCKSRETKVYYSFCCLWSMFFIVMGFSCPTNGFQWIKISVIKSVANSFSLCCLGCP